jgi:hypothetical protein
MDDNSVPAPVPANDINVPYPPSSIFPITIERPLRLRPLWIGFLLAFIELLFLLLTHIFTGNDLLVGLCMLFSGLAGIGAIVYYCMSIHRLIRVLRTQPDWSSEYTPAGVVWRQFIPLYNLVVLYQWTGDVESYVDWRLGITSKAGLWTFIGLMIGFAFASFHQVVWVGYAIITGSLAFLYVPVRRALLVAPPADGAAPRYDGSLGLR